MIGIILNNEIKLFGSIPKTWNNILNYHLADAQVHYDDGFRDVVQPTYNTETQRKGGIYFDEVNDVFTYEVIDKTIEEIQAEMLANSESNRNQKIKEASEAMIVAELMNETDIEMILGNLDIYPLWEVGLSVKNKTDNPNGIPDRFKHFNAENELTLYEVVLSHTTQGDWQPKDTPNLFKVVAPDGVIPIWVEPKGEHDAYQIDDLVHFPTESDPVYRNTVYKNVYAPDVYGWVLND